MTAVPILVFVPLVVGRSSGEHQFVPGFAPERAVVNAPDPPSTSFVDPAKDSHAMPMARRDPFRQLRRLVSSDGRPDK
jgi:hypothetical protein